MKRVEIVKLSNDEVIWKSDATTERMAERMERGLNINLNHETHYSRIVDVQDVSVPHNTTQTS